MKNLLILSMVFFATLSLSAQDGDFSAGLRLGPNGGFTAKWYATEDVDLEAIISLRDKGVQLIGLVEFSQPLGAEENNLRWYYGGGAHVGIQQFTTTQVDIENPSRRLTSRPSIGVDAIVGIEYKPPVIPFSFSVDYKPYVDFFYWKRFYRNVSDFSFSIRYVF